MPTQGHGTPAADIGQLLDIRDHARASGGAYCSRDFEVKTCHEDDIQVTAAGKGVYKLTVAGGYDIRHTAMFCPSDLPKEQESSAWQCMAKA